MRWLATIVILAGCGRLGFDRDSELFADGPVDSDATLGAITVQRGVGGWGPLDLTAEGDLDWKHFGIGTTNTVNQKASGGGLIGDAMQVGGGVLIFADKQDPQLDTTWSDGTPDASVVAPVSTTFMVDTPNPSGDGWAFEVAATTSPRTLRVNAGVWCARLRLDARLLDHSAPDVVDKSWDFPFSAYEVGTYSIHFRASQDTKLEVTLLIDENYCTSGDVGEVWLSSIVLSDG